MSSLLILLFWLVLAAPLVVLFLVIPLLAFGGSGMIGLCSKSEDLRPPWFDWGLDDEKSASRDDESSK